jgi:hypothetical protein
LHIYFQSWIGQLELNHSFFSSTHWMGYALAGLRGGTFLKGVWVDLLATWMDDMTTKAKRIGRRIGGGSNHGYSTLGKMRLSLL